MISIDSTVAANKDQVYSEVGDEIVILNARTGTYFGLDPIGADIWRLIQEPVPVARVRDAILESYAVEQADCERDLLDLLREMADLGLIDVLP